MIKALEHFQECIRNNYHVDECGDYIDRIEKLLPPTEPESTQAEGSQFEATPNADSEIEEILHDKDYYKIFGLPKEATSEELKKAYKKVNS